MSDINFLCLVFLSLSKVIKFQAQKLPCSTVFNCFLCQIFSPYGQVEDVYLMRDELKQSRGMPLYSYLIFKT